MIKKISILLSCMAAICVLIMDACKSSRSVTSTNETPSIFFIPPGWPKPALNIFKDNPLTEEGFQLGRKLFYDGILSMDGSLSCGTCHQQFAAFSSFDHNFSHGINNTFTTRNAPGLFNLAWMKELHWDGGVNHIEVQPLSPITAHNEMGSILDTVLYNLQKDNSYKTFFKRAFGDTVINSQRMLKALAQFTGSIQSCNTKYDRVKNDKASFTISEQKGYEFFKANCNACHKEPLFTDNSFHNNGLSVNDKLNDWGHMKISKRAADSLKFKTPSLRNVAVTLPYMHDGRFINLSKVLQHYQNLNIDSSKNLDPILKAKKINISSTERVDLLAFLYTLTDSVMIHDSRYSSPLNSSPVFKHKH